GGVRQTVAQADLIAGVVPRPPRRVAPPGHAAAHHRENAAQSVAALQNAFRAICVVETLQFGGNQVERLVPRNALPLVPAAQFFLAAARLPVLALHRVLETVSAEALMLLRAAAR